MVPEINPSKKIPVDPATDPGWILKILRLILNEFFFSDPEKGIFRMDPKITPADPGWILKILNSNEPSEYLEEIFL